MRLLIVLLMLLVACGTADNNKTSCVTKGDNCGDGTASSPVPGPPGPPGPQGPSGVDGFGVVFQSLPDTTNQCATGGYIILLAQDTKRDGKWYPSNKNQSSFAVCNGANGSNGTNGAQGAQGPQGEPGAAGQNTTPITAVQFCPGYTTNYPSTFPEFGLCLNSQIYAVYWDGHNAWLALVAPGYWASTSTSAPCNFHVLANCQVTP